MKEPVENFDVCVVGAGPAGLMAAIAAAGHGVSVVLCEQLDRPGAKLLTTGGGRCNLTNSATEEKFLSAFGRQGRFAQPALAQMNSEGLRAFFNELGLSTVCEDGFHFFPTTNRSMDVLSALMQRCEQLKIHLLANVRVEGLVVESKGDGGGKHITGIQTNKGSVVSTRVILATGGKSYPQLGATGGGYELAKSVGHTIVEPLPALVGLVTEEAWPARCAGLSVSRARVWIDLPGCPKSGRTGDVLFTHKGISGPAVLDISGDVAQKLQNHPAVPVCLDLTHGITKAQWLKRLDDWGHNEGSLLIRTLLGSAAPSRLVATILSLSGVELETVASQVSRPQRDAIAELLTALPLTVRASEGFDKAMITRGGVSLKEVDPRTLESKLVAGLYFAGEVLDLDGPCGGYNLQWAFSSGNLAGASAVNGLAGFRE